MAMLNNQMVNTMLIIHTYIYTHVIRVLCPKVFRDNCRNPYFWLWGVVQVLRVKKGNINDTDENHDANN